MKRLTRLPALARRAIRGRPRFAAPAAPASIKQRRETGASFQTPHTYHRSVGLPVRLRARTGGRIVTLTDPDRIYGRRSCPLTRSDWTPVGARLGASSTSQPPAPAAARVLPRLRGPAPSAGTSIVRRLGPYLERVRRALQASSRLIRRAQKALAASAVPSRDQQLRRLPAIGQVLLRPRRGVHSITGHTLRKRGLSESLKRSMSGAMAVAQLLVGRALRSARSRRQHQVRRLSARRGRVAAVGGLAGVHSMTAWASVMGEEGEP